MDFFLTLAFLFFIGSVAGWVVELLFRRFFSSANPDRKWINPGFCSGPYLPLYGVGLCLMYVIALLEGTGPFQSPVLGEILLCLIMALCMTALEFAAGSLALKIANVRLWDYTGQWGNVRGVICPKFSLVWAAFGALYTFFVHRHVKSAVAWLFGHLSFSFFIGLFFGVFLVDLAQSAQLVSKLKKFAEDYDVIVRYEALKAIIRAKRVEARLKYYFFRPFFTERPLIEHLLELKESFERRIKRR